MTQDTPQASGADSRIAVHWHEEKYVSPPESFVRQANLTDKSIFDRFSLDHFPDCFAEYAELLDWDRRWDQVFDGSNPPFWKWFVGGRLNACYNCVDRHLERYADKVAFHYVAEDENVPIEPITYRQLYDRVNEFAALLRDFCGLEAGDRVTLHMPMVPELPITMLACARLGVIHSQVFSGFSGRAAGERIEDSGSRVLITMDAYNRGGKLIDHKKAADIAVEQAQKAGQKVDKVLVWQRYPERYASDTPLVDGQDHVVQQVLENYRGAQIEPVSMQAEDPLFLMYTSGTTGQPKGAQHRTGGYLAYVAATSKYIQDIQPDDVYWCMADIGWITGHSYIVYGPLALAATSVLYEGAPTVPDAARPWRIAERLGVNIFHTSPTAVRALRKAGPDEPARHDFHFKHMTTVGEPIEPEVWRWYHQAVGKGEAVIVDTWWQTENGGFLCSTVPALHDMKPGSAGPALPGIHPVIYDDQSNEIPAGGGAGYICIRNPWPGIMQTIWGNPERFVKTYYERFCKDENSTDWRDWPYFAGDGAMLAEDGYYRILGRIDDVINVAGHRLGTKEIESAALTVAEVAEAAAVAVPDETKGMLPEVYISLTPGSQTAHDAVAEKVVQAIVDEIGPISKPRNVHIVPDMPKTRSGKIMRRVLASISQKQDPGDVSTLANPEVVDEIRQLLT